MFSSYQHLKRKTPEQGINRQEFIEHLVEEYYTTTDVEAQEQVTANLANFSYDPINWDYLKTSEALKLFIELLESPNVKLQLHGAAGLCNICLDQQSFNYIVKPQNINKVRSLLLKSNNLDIILNLLTLLYQLLSNPKSCKASILNTTILKRINHFKNQHQQDQRIVNITSLLTEDFAQRYELIEVNINIPDNNKKKQPAEQLNNI
ncbi:uncharacterized protein ACRADG_000471 [Cochliomyia hominivorax]